MGVAEDMLVRLAKQSDRLYGPVNQMRAMVGQPAKTGVGADALKRMFDAAYDYEHFPVKPLTGTSTRSGAQTFIPDLTPLEQQKQDMKVQEAKISGAGDLAKHDSWWDTIKNKGMGTAAHLIDYSSRFGDASRAALDEMMDRSRGEGSSSGALFSRMMERGGEAFVGKPGSYVSGEDLINENIPQIKGMSGGWQKSALQTGLGTGLEIVTDPTTYVGTGATNVASKSAKEVLAKGTKALAVDAGKTVTKEVGKKTVANKILSAARRQPVGKVPATPIKGVQKSVDTISENLKIGQTIAKSGRRISDVELKSSVAKEVAEMVKPGSGSAVRHQAQKDVSKLLKEMKDKGINIDEIDAVARDAMVQARATELADPFSKQVYAVLKANTQRKAQFKILGHDIFKGKAGEAIAKQLYKPFGGSLKGLSKIPGAGAVRAGFSMSEHFPGLSNRIRRLAESQGIVRHEMATKEINKISKGLTKQELEDVSRALEMGVRSTGSSVKSGKDLGEVYDYFDNFRKDAFQEMKDAGIYKGSDDVGSFFMPQYYRKGGAKEIKDFKSGRKAALRGNPNDFTKQADFTLDAAKDAGLKPYTRVDDAFKMYDADIARKLTRENYRFGLLDQYGTRTSAHEAMKKQGMKDYSHLVPQEVRQQMEKDGEKMYLHPEFAKSLDAMEKFAKMGNNDELNKFMRQANRFTNWFKQSATVANPGNWVNNTMGDVFLNSVDGLQNPIWYKKAMSLLKNESNAAIKVGEYEISAQRMKQLYNKWAKGAGFLQAQTDTPLHGITGKVSHLYQSREDMSRMAHFMYAMDEEFKRLEKTVGKGNLKPIRPFNMKGEAFEKRLNDVAERAAERVNKWNLDYSAFTPMERQIKKFVPFYSWQRKSIPLMLEALATKPGRVTSVRHIQQGIESLLTDDERGDYDTAYPQWLRDAGFMRLGGGPNPTVIKDPLPTNVFGGTFGGSNWGDVLRNQGAALHPGLRMPIEMMGGEQLYTGAKIPSDTTKYLAQQLPFLNPLSAAMGQDLKAGFDEGTTPIKAGQRIGSFLGSKPYDVTDEMQISELKRQQDTLDYKLTQLNKATAPWGVRHNSDGSWQVYNEETKFKGPKTNSPAQAQKDVIYFMNQDKVAAGGKK